MTAQGQTADVSKRDRIKPCLLLILISLVLAGGFFHFFLFWTQEKTALAKNTVAITVSSEINATVSGSQKFKSKKISSQKVWIQAAIADMFYHRSTEGGDQSFVEILGFASRHSDLQWKGAPFFRQRQPVFQRSVVVQEENAVYLAGPDYGRKNAGLFSHV